MRGSFFEQMRESGGEKRCSRANAATCSCGPGSYSDGPGDLPCRVSQTAHQDVPTSNHP